MPKKANTYNSRLIATMQSIGRAGKSTFMQLLIEALQETELTVGCIDLDGTHRTLSKWYEGIYLKPFEIADDLADILNFAGGSDVEILDFPAQKTPAILEGLDKFRAKEIFEEKGIRLTVPIFANNQSMTLESAATIIEATKDYVDYVVITSPGVFPCNTFLESKLMNWLTDAPIIEIPSISPASLAEINRVTKAIRKQPTLRETIGHAQIASRNELEYIIDNVGSQIAKHKEFFVPDPSKVTFKNATKSKDKKQNVMDVFDLM